MDATQVFLYAASIASITILVLVALAFYFLYQTLNRIQSFFVMAESLLTEIQLVKTGTALNGFRMLRSVFNIFRKGGE